MKKFATLLVIVGLLVILIFIGVGRYNDLVTKDENVSKAWAQVENVYQRRADLIPNLVSTVKGYADFEQETLLQVVEARSKATGINVNVDDLSPEAVSKFQAAQDQLSGALSRLLVVVEKYPDLKANQSFLDLQAQLEGTENRITVERNRFNESVGVYNTAVRRFPGSVYASIFGFEKKGYFEAVEGSEVAPKVEF